MRSCTFQWYTLTFIWTLKRYFISSTKMFERSSSTKYYSVPLSWCLTYFEFILCNFHFNYLFEFESQNTNKMKKFSSLQRNRNAKLNVFVVVLWGNVICIYTVKVSDWLSNIFDYHIILVKAWSVWMTIDELHIQCRLKNFAFNASQHKFVETNINSGVRTHMFNHKFIPQGIIL